MAQVWVATAPINVAPSIRAFNRNDIVPDSVATAMGLEAEGLVVRREVDISTGQPSHGVDPVMQPELDALVTGNGRLSEVSLRAASVAAAKDSGAFAEVNDGAVTDVRTAGDGKASGAMNWRHKGDDGYLIHLTSGVGNPTSTLTALLALGTDQRNLTGLYIAHKNTGSAFHIAQYPGASLGLFKQGYSTSTLDYSEVYVGNQGVRTFARTGQGFADGVATQGSTTFTSATAAFAAGDVGKSISQPTYTGSPDVQGTIPAGTTITAVNSATSVTLSQAAGQSGTAVRFLVAGRVPGAAQKLHTWYDHDDATVMEILRTLVSTQVPIVAKVRAADKTPLTVEGMAGGTQTASLLKVHRNGDATGAFEVIASGLAVTRRGASVQNSADTAAVPLTVNNSGAGTVATAVNAAASQTADILQINANGGVRRSRFDREGRLGISTVTAPADSQVLSSEAVLYLDDTVGAPKLMAKVKDSAGTVFTLTVAP